jgi:AcrR family transcriptional regulator
MSGSYTRESQQVRRQAFVDATIACLADHGYHGTSVRKIAERAGVAPGLLTHYYKGKEELIVAAYGELADTTFDYSQRAVERAGDDPQARLRAFVTASFFGPDLPFNILKVWVNFWTLTLTDPMVRKAHARTYGRFRARLGQLIGDAFEAQNRDATAAEIEHLAIGANAVIDGLWLEYSLDPDTFDAVQAAEIACAFIGRGIGVELESDGEWGGAPGQR